MKNKSQKNKSYFAAYYKAAKPALKYKWCYVVLTLIGIILIAADLAFAQNSRKLFDLAPEIPQNTAIQIIITFIIIIFIQYIFGFLDKYVYRYFNESVIYTMRRDTLAKIQRLTMKFFDNNHTSGVANILHDQVEVVKNFVVTDVRNLIKLPLSFILIGGYLFTLHPYLGITAVISSILQPLSNLTFRKPLYKAMDGQRKVSRVASYTMHEAIHGIREVKINQIEDFNDNRMNTCQKGGVQYNLAYTKYSTFREIIKEMPIKIGYIFGLSMGIFLMLAKIINPGDLVAFITLIHKVSEPFDGITQLYSTFQGSIRSANDLLNLIDEEEENYTDGENLNLPVESIKFNGVNFRYDIIENTDRLIFANGEYEESDSSKKEVKYVEVLNDVNFEIKGGSTVALVGPSGSGKSTIIKLLYKFYEVSGGEITVNGRPINNYNINSLRSAMSIVSQDIFMFDGTVYENLVLGRDNITDADIENALKMSESYDFVQKLPEGIHTHLGERGIKLSQGQKQRLSIARSIIKKANVIILDEPTSALDVETEYLFQQNMTKWTKDCTKIIIAHRLTTIRDADYILFLDDGKIIEQGSPYDLIKKENGKFKDYWEKQFLFQNEK